MDKFFCSWSGGKDSCLALYKAIQSGGNPTKLVTMLLENGERSRSHGLALSVLQKQAESLNILLSTSATSWDDYENNFISVMIELKQQEGIREGVFGDIDLEEHRQWVERVCQSVGVKPHLPLWQTERHILLQEWLDLGFKAVIIAVKDGKLDRSFLGKELTPELITKIEKKGIDAAGEEGEFHTVVTDGPLFAAPIHLQFKDQILRDGYWFQDVVIDENHKFAAPATG